MYLYLWLTGFVVTSIYFLFAVFDNGSIYSPDILDIKPEDLIKTFLSVSSLRVDAFHYVTKASMISQFLINFIMTFVLLILGRNERS